MKNHLAHELQDFLDFLLKNGYCDTDVYDESPTALDAYFEIRKPYSDGKNVEDKAAELAPNNTPIHEAFRTGFIACYEWLKYFKF